MNDIKIEIDLDKNPPDPSQAGNIVMSAIEGKIRQDQARARRKKIWLALIALVILWVLFFALN